MHGCSVMREHGCSVRSPEHGCSVRREHAWA